MSPTAGQRFTVKGLLAHSNQGGVEPGPVIHFGKKPFDWMTDSQWQMLLVGISSTAAILQRVGLPGQIYGYRSIKTPFWAEFCVRKAQSPSSGHKAHARPGTPGLSNCLQISLPRILIHCHGYLESSSPALKNEVCMFAVTVCTGTKCCACTEDCVYAICRKSPPVRRVIIILQMLASWFTWVHPILEKQGKDGKDALWRTIGEGISPETITLTESLGYK